MGEMDRGHLEVSTKLWNLIPYGKTNGELTRISQLIAAYQKVKKEAEDWGDYKRLPEEIPEISFNSEYFARSLHTMSRRGEQ